MEDDFTPVDPKLDYETPKTAADRFREATTMPDFGVPEVQSNDEIFAQAPTPMPLDIARSLVDGAKIREGIGEQTAVAVENALTSVGALGDQATLAIGQLTNYFTGNSIGEDFMEPALKSLELRKEDMMYAEDSVGGIRNLIAQLGGGAVSMGELFLTSLATGGVGAYLQMGVEAFGEGAYNDMEKYKKEHDGSLKGYEPKTLDVAINTGNAFLQAWIEKNIGVGKKSFIDGWSMPLLKAVAKESISGFEQESLQSLLSDLAEVAKGNEKVATLLENAEGYLRDGLVGAILQGGLGAATYHYNHNAAVKDVAKARAIAHGREEPNAEDMTHGKNLINAKERGYASGLTKEFKAAFDASTGEGQLQAKIANALKKAVETKELDLDTANETEMAQRIEQIATQETLNAMDFAREQNRAISDMELNDIVYKDGAIWLEGLTPQVGDRAVSYARVLAERQSGLAEVNMKLDTINQEIATLKKDLAEVTAENKQAQAEKIKAQIKKRKALAEKNRLKAEQLKAQTAKLEKQIAEQLKEAPKAETIKTEEVSAEVKPVEAPKREVLAQVKKKEPIAERKSLKEERVEKKKTKAEKETEQKLADVYNKIMAQAKQVAKKQLSEISQEEKAQANKTTYTDKGEFFSKSKGDVYIRIIPQIDDVTNTYVVKYQTYARNTDTERISNNLGNYTGEFRLGSAGWGKRELADTKERLEKIVNKMINDFGEEYAFFDMEHTDDSLKYLAEGHQQEEPEALKYKNQELRDLEQQGFEEQYKIKTGKEWEGRKTPSVDDEGLLHQVKPEKYEGDTIEVDGKERTVYNSNGDRIAKSKEALTNFWRWFGDSKVVDEQGRPLVVHHGSEALDIEEFDTVFGRREIYFSTNEDVSRTYYSPQGKGRTYDMYLRIEKPYVFDANGVRYDEIRFDFEGIRGTEIENLVLAVRESSSNYDGVIVKNVIDMSDKTKTQGIVADDYIIFDETQAKSPDNIGTFSRETGKFLQQGSISGKGDTNRGGYDDALKRIILGEKSDLSTIQHEFAHYWIQNNFKWARSGLASQDWLRRWRDVEEWLGIEPQDRLLSKSASEKFAKAYERYILEGKVAPELQWAFEGFQKAYQDIYDDLEKEYFDLEEELAPEVIDWFNRNKEQSPKRLLQADEKKLEKALTLSAGGSVIEEAPENTVIMTEQNDKGQPVEYMGIKQSEIPAGDNLLVYADKTTASKLQQSAKRYFGDSVEVQQLATLDTEATLKNFKDWISRDRQGAWNAMMNPDTRPVYRSYLYKAFADQAMNDVNLAMELANIDMAKSVRELGQAIQALNIRNESGFDPIEIIRNIEKSKGTLSEEELNNSIAEMGLDNIELSDEEMNEIDTETECKL